MAEDPTQLHPLDALEQIFCCLFDQNFSSLKGTLYQPQLDEEMQAARDLLAEVREEIKGWEQLVADQSAEIDDLQRELGTF